MTRHELREHVFMMLFRVEFHSADELEEQNELYLEEIEGAEDKDRQYILDKANRIREQIADIDSRIEAVSESWKLNRIGKAELTIIRLAAYEIMHDDDVPAGVAINEAVELAKKYCGEDSPAFVNGVLSKFVE